MRIIDQCLVKMPRYDFHTTRLFVSAPLAPAATVSLDRFQINYLVHVLRLAAGDPVLVFNGRDGEWRANLVIAPKRQVALTIVEQARPQPAPGDLHYLFAPL